MVPMTELSHVDVRLDDRIRLMSVLLAATDWPDRAQARKPHGCHAHARHARKFVADYAMHPAVQALQGLLHKGAPPEALFTLAAVMSWPDMLPARLPSWASPEWPAQIRDFYETAAVEQLWQDESAAWSKAVDEAGRMLNGVAIQTFLQPFFGTVSERLVFMPNISYPADLELGVRAAGELVAIVPPRLAWGDSAPWPFDNDPVYVQRAALTQYVRLLLPPYLRANADALAAAEKTALPVPDDFAKQYPTWTAQFMSLFVSALTAIYLEDCVSAVEAKSYVLMERKAFGVALLPSIVRVLRHYLEGVSAGRYSELADFLPHFPKQVRVAKRIVSL
jgi:hypothetical protein